MLLGIKHVKLWPDFPARWSGYDLCKGQEMIHEILTRIPQTEADVIRRELARVTYVLRLAASKTKSTASILRDGSDLLRTSSMCANMADELEGKKHENFGA
jgi:hypothetical protein